MPSGSSQEPGARLFFALWPPTAISEVLHTHAAALAQQHGGRAMRQQTLHLTLAFLGQVPHDRLPRVREAADTLAADSFPLQIDHIGFWPHNRILWAGSATISRQVEELAGTLSSALQNVAQWPITTVARPFVPHLTLVRNVRDPIRELPSLQPMCWQCEGFVLVRSRPSAHGAGYETIGEWRLR